MSRFAGGSTCSPRAVVQGDLGLATLVRHFPDRGVRSAPVQELRTGRNGLDQHADAISTRCEPGVHPLYERFIREQQGPAQRVYQQFTAQIVQKILFTVRVDVGLQADQTVPLTSSG